MQIEFLQEYNVHKAWRRLRERLLCWTITGPPEGGPSPEGRGVSVAVTETHTHTSRQRAMGNRPPSLTLNLLRFHFFLFFLLCLIEIYCVLPDADKVPLLSSGRRSNSDYVLDTAIKKRPNGFKVTA